MNNQTIKAIFLANGFKEKPQASGSTDLNPYVYAAARALLASSQGEPVAHKIEFNDGHKSGWYDGPPSSVDTDDVVDGVIAGVQLAYAEQPAPVSVVPAGWKLVPIQPTPEMLSRIGADAKCPELPRQHAISTWETLLAAAPSAPGTEQGVGDE